MSGLDRENGLLCAGDGVKSRFENLIAGDADSENCGDFIFVG
jgi:hypothetical protein